MISIGAREGSQGQLLAHPGQPAEVPTGTGEGALGVLPLDSQDRQAVGLKFDAAAQDRIIEPQACVDCWQGNGNSFLLVGASKALKGPALDRDIAVHVDALGADEVTQAIVAGDVVAPGDSLVSRGPERASNRPVGVELEAPITFEIAAESPAVGRRQVDLVGVGDVAIGDEGAKLVGAEAG